MKQKVANQGFKKNFILYKGHTGWKVKTRLFGSLVVALSAVTLAEGSGSVDAHAATDDSTATGQMTKTVKDSEKPSSQVALRSSVKPSAASVPPAGQESNENLNPDTVPDDDTTKDAAKQPVSESEPLTPTTPEPPAADDSTNGTSEDKTSDSGSQYPVLSQDGTTEIGVDNTEVHLTADQIADHFTATVVDRDNNDKNVNPTKNTHVQTIGKDGSVALTSNDAHDVYSQYGTKTSITGHQVAHVSFEHEIDFGHDFSLSGALGIGTKTDGGADSVGVVFAPGDPAKATEGGSGGDLGIGGLANAFGFVFDEYPNSDKNDPSTPYFGWRTTDSNGNLQRVASSSEWMLASSLNLNNRSTNPLNDFTMEYSAADKTLTVILGGQTFVRQISDTSQGYSISIAASTGGSQNDYSARIDKFTYTPKTMPLDYQMVDSADQGALLDQAKVQAIANVGDTVSVFSTQAAAARAVAAGLVDPNLISILPTDKNGNVYVIDGTQTPSSTGTAKTIDNSGVADNTYYSYTVQDGDNQSVTIPVRLAFKAKVTPVDSKTGQPIAGLDPVTVVAVDGEPTLVQIPGYTPTKVTLAAPAAGQEVADDQLPIDQGSTNTGTSTTTTDDTATPISHYYVGTGQTVDGQTVTTGTVMAGTGQSVSDNFNQQPLVGSNGQAVTSGGTTITSSDYYWSTTGNAGATDSTDEANPQAGGSLLLPTTSTLEYWEAQATDNQTKADNYKAQAQQMYDKFMGITGLTQAQKDDAQALLQSVSKIYTDISAANGEAKTDFEAAKGATAANDIYEDGQNGYASLEKVQNLLVSFEADLTDLDDNNTDAASSLATFESWSEDYGSPITVPVVSFGPDFWTNGTKTSADFSNPDYYAFYSTDAADGAPVTPKAVGNYFFKLTDAGRAYLKSLNPNNDKIGLYVSAMLTINPVATAATVDAATIDYGGGHAADGTVGTWPAFTGSLGTADADHTVSSADFEVVDGSGKVVTDITKLQAKGNYTIRYTQKAQDELAKDQNYTFTSFGTAKLTVTPRQITVAANNHGKTFGTTKDPKLDLTSDSASGLVNGDTLDSLGVTLTRAAGENAGTYDITEDESSPLNSNYEITVNIGTFTIARLPVTVQAKDLSKTYGDDDPQLVLVDTLVDGHQLTDKDFTLSRDVGESVGTYKITGSDVAASNYNVTVKTGTLTINPKDIAVTVDNKTKTYGEANPGFTASYNKADLVNADDDLGLTFNRDDSTNNDAGTYTINAKSSSKNYDVTIIAGILTINPKDIAITVDNKTKTYGEADPEFTASYNKDDLVNADDSLGLTFSREDATNNDAGTYAINAKSSNKNYEVTITAGTLTINPKDIAVTVDDKTKTYGEADPEFTASYNKADLVNVDDDLGLTFNRDDATNNNAGTYKIDAKSSNKNYEVTITAGTLTINPKDIAVTVDNKTKTYGEADPEFTASYDKTNLVNADDDLGLTFNREGSTNNDVGTYTISAESSNQNYDVTITAGTLTIDPKAIAVTVDDKKKTYGEADPEFTATYNKNDLVNADDDLGLTFSREDSTNNDVGTYKINAKSSSKNYDVTITAGTLTINPKDIAVIVDNKTKTYGEADPAFTASYDKSDLVNADDNLGLTFSRDDATNNNAGTYAINAKSSNENYNVTITAGTLTINPKDIAVTVDNKTKTYGEADPAFMASYDKANLVNADDDLGLTFSRDDPTNNNAGTYTISAKSSSKNYAVAITAGTLTINPKAITVTVDNKSKTYDEADPAFTASYDKTDLVNTDDDLGLTFSRNDPTNNNVGTYDINVKAKNQNYAVEAVPGQLKILGYDVDSVGNVTVTEKDSAGNVTKVIKKWNDGSTTTYTYDPNTGEREVTEQQKDGKTSVASGDTNVTMPDAPLADGSNVNTTVDTGAPGSEPVIEHYTTKKDVDDANNVTTTTKDATGNVTKVTKDWNDGSTTTYTYNPTTGVRKVTEQRRDRTTVSEQTINSGDTNVILPDAALPDGSDIETTVDPGQPGSQPTFEHYTTHEDVDKSNNVITTTKDSTGNVTKVIKKWNDGSTTTYTYDPNTGNRNVTEQQKNGETSDKSFAPGDSSVTLPDGNGGTIVVKIDKSDTQPTITHYPASHNVVVDTPTDESTSEPEKPVTITKQWPDGSKIIYTYDPVTTKRLIRELRNGYLIEQQAVAPGSLRTILSDNNGGVIIVQFDKSGTVPFFTRQTANEMNDRYSQSATISNAGHARNLAETKRVHSQQEKKLPQTGQENESSLVRLGELLLTLLAVPFIFRRRH